ncbi:MAG: tol-pal system protein YbgF [Methylovirgula sp.]
MTGNKGALALVAASMLILGCYIAQPGMAQDSTMPPGDVGAPGSDQYGAPGAPETGAPPAGSDEASLLLRVERLEDQIRQMNGQIQQMQYDNRKLADQLRKFQEDVDFRFQEGGHKGLPRHEDSGALAAPAAPLAGAPLDTAPMGGATQSTALPAAPLEANHERGDAFNPSTDPNAPGAPRPLGTTPPSAPLPPDTASAADSDAPINLPSSGYNATPAVPAESATAVPQPGAPAGAVTTPGGTVLASTEVDAPKEEFDVALGYFKQKDYDNAGKSFSAFLEKNPKTRWTSDALYYLGETYYERGRQREAAEQYLKISTDYASSPLAPEAMLRLGESLQALGAKEQACATVSEVPRKYPIASAAVKAGAEREAKRAQC